MCSAWTAIRPCASCEPSLVPLARALANRIAERLGGAAPRLAVLPGCGHVSHEEAPAVLLDFLGAFVGEVQRA